MHKSKTHVTAQATHLLHLSCEHKQAAADTGSESGAGVRMCAALCSARFVGLSMQRGDAAATSASFLPSPHPSALFLPSAVPLSNLTTNLPPSIDSSAASLSFVAVSQCRLGAVLPSAAGQDVREAGKKPQIPLSVSLVLFLPLHCTGNSFTFVTAWCDRSCAEWWQSLMLFSVSERIF